MVRQLRSTRRNSSWVKQPIVCNLLLGGIDGSMDIGCLMEFVAIKHPRSQFNVQKATDPSSSNGRPRTLPNHRQHQMEP
ncbi:unnamed protein product [Bursaphelenchus okinawaensis]|uniref:Uncharacterized protein n=1 Tax=Bursaphelenchus okinawaensis TaxID=465554 RepID=A0A811JQX2_9BILA|nr:unnamed protein product [Bursaphelenchus okinawaensis]CAG9078995.1 unnamed protein product [Bursaphelenchus okinawaensis]